MESWAVYALLGSLFAGLTGIFGKVGVKDVNSNLATTVRAVIMAVGLMIFILARHETAGLDKIKSQTWLFIALSGAAGAASWVCMFRALQLGEASRVAPIDKSSVLITVIFAILFLGEKLTWDKALGAFLVAGGTILIALAK
ncbi:MAG: EamA family transporter [Abitibacteriaceae bacterium]|nr:EamA family transporter [Abditibacteriaceae bacterium]